MKHWSPHMVDAPDLPACPFCGGCAVRHAVGGGLWFRTYCGTYPCVGNTITSGWATQAQADAAWSKRERIRDLEEAITVLEGLRQAALEHVGHTEKLAQIKPDTLDHKIYTERVREWAAEVKKLGGEYYDLCKSADRGTS